MEIFLIKHKQTNAWPSNIATREAVFAILADTSKFSTTATVPVKVTLGATDITKLAAQNSLIVPGSGYFKYSLEKNMIKDDMYNITISKNTDKNIAWGGIYWQFTEDISNINPAGKNIRIKRELYKQTSDNGKVIYTKVENTTLKPGDRIKIRLIVNSDREMQNICIRDYRPAAFEPVKTDNGYDYFAWKGYYKVVKDECTEFYFRSFPKGSTYLEYEAYVKYKGSFTGGYSEAQSLYSPEFVTNSKGVNIMVK